MKLKDIENEFDKYIARKDPWVLSLIMATLVGNALINRDPIWSMIVAPSSGGKTTFIAPATGVSYVYFIDDMTEKTLLSGYKVKGKEVSLLTTIGSGIMAFSDFTSILSKNPNSRGEILTQLKLVYDQKVTKYTGTGSSKWEGKIGFLGAATPDIYYHLESGRSMGERFLYYWLEQPTDEEIAAKQQGVKISANEITKLMAPMYGEYCQSVREWIGEHGLPDLSITKEQRERIWRAAIFCVNGKATVHTNYKTGKVDQIPNKAGVGRDSKMFDALLHALQIMDAMEAGDPKKPVSDERIEMIEKCAYSSINRERRKILEILGESATPMSGSQIGASKGLGLEKESVEIYLAPLHAVGLISKKAGNPHTWFIEDAKIREFVRKVSKRVKDATPERGNVIGEVSDEPDDQPARPKSEDEKRVDELFDNF